MDMNARPTRHQSPREDDICV